MESKTAEKTVGRIISGLSQTDLNSGLAVLRTELDSLNAKLTNQIASLSAQTSLQTASTYQAISLTNKIDSLSGTSLTNITVSGVSGLTDSDIPNDITASNYLPLAGGTISGSLILSGQTTLTNATATSFTAANAWFTDKVGIGTSSPYAKLSVVGPVVAEYFHATSTTATSTFAGGMNVAGSAGLTVLQNGNVGIGTSTPGGVFHVVSGSAGILIDANSYISLGNNDAGSVANPGDGNNVFGYKAGVSLQASALVNTLIGGKAGNKITTGVGNTAVGDDTLIVLTTGGSNTAVGRKSLYNLTTGNNNVALGGYGTGVYNQTGNQNIYVGSNAGRGVSGTSHSNNTFIGHSAGYSINGGNNNIFLGYQAGDAITSGANNIVFGYDIDTPSPTSANTLNIGNIIFGTGIDGTGSTLSSGNIGIGTSSPYALLSISNNLNTPANTPLFTIASTTAGTATSTLLTVLANGKTGIGTNNPQQKLHVYRSDDGAPVRFEDSNGYCEIDPTSTSWTCTSDRTLKKDITNLSSANSLSKLSQLQAVNFKWLNQDNSDLRYGFVAQDVETILPDFVRTDEKGIKSVNYGGFTPLMIDAIKELNLKVSDLQASVSASSLPAGEAGGTGSDGLFAWILNKFNAIGITFGQDKIGAKNLCAKKSDGSEVCVDGDQLQSLLDKNGITQSSSSSSSVSSSSSSESSQSSSSSSVASSSSESSSSSSSETASSASSEASSAESSSSSSSSE